MQGMNTWIASLAAAAAAFWIGRRLWRRAELSFAKHPSLEGHPRWSRRLARLLPYYAYDDEVFFSVDGAPLPVAQQRRNAFEALGELLRTRHRLGRELTAEATEGLSDLQFTARYRVPFQFSQRVRETLGGDAFVTSTSGMTVRDTDGNQAFDLTGSYGVNVFGNDFYKGCIERGSAAVRELGPVLGALHPVVIDNVRRLRAISGMDEISFHMSGTEAVMQAVRLARYHTRRRYAVRFCGAYHGWWGDVQPGTGNPLIARDTLTLHDMSESALRVLRHRRDIACVLVNPLQGLHPNRGAPADSALIAARGSYSFDREAYAAWLQRLRQICDQRGIALILDEVFLGFRLAPGGAQEYFGVKADLVTYGKTVAGGLPIGLVAGRSRWMRRFNPDRPGDICFARGTFNSHPYVMGAMNEFLRALETEPLRALYRDLDQKWSGRAEFLNQQLMKTGAPVRVANLSTVWALYFTQPSRYHWMLQYYLRAQGLALSWVGSGRLIFTLNCTDAEFSEVVQRVEAAARAMHSDGWWWIDPTVNARSMQRRVLREMLQARCSSVFSSVIGSISSPRSK
mgnify:CR=1 FL=1